MRLKKKKRNSFNTQKLPSVFSHMPHCKNRICKCLLVCPRGIVLSRTKSWNLGLLPRLFSKRLQLKTSDIHRKRKSDSQSTNTKNLAGTSLWCNTMLVQALNIYQKQEHWFASYALSAVLPLFWPERTTWIICIMLTVLRLMLFIFQTYFWRLGLTIPLNDCKYHKKKKKTRREEGRDLHPGRPHTNLLIDKLILGLLFHCVWNNFIFYPSVFLKNTFLYLIYS